MIALEVGYIGHARVLRDGRWIALVVALGRWIVILGILQPDHLHTRLGLVVQLCALDRDGAGCRLTLVFQEPGQVRVFAAVVFGIRIVVPGVQRAACERNTDA